MGAAGGTGERVAREPLTGRGSGERNQVVGSGPVGERATPTRYAVRGPYPWDRTRAAEPLWIALGLLPRSLDALAVGERVLHRTELRERRTAVVLHALAKGRVAGIAAGEIGVAAGGVDRTHDAIESVRLLELLLRGQRLSLPLVLRTSQQAIACKPA